MAIWTAVIWLSVSVPVLSELMAEVEPSVSTERRRLTMAPAAASVWVPIERMAVTTAGRPVGIADTENAMAVSSRVSNGHVAEHADADRGQQRDTRDDEDLVGQLLELDRERRLLVLLDLEHAADVADLGGHAGGRRDEGAGTAGDLGVHERHVDPVAQRGVRRDALDLLGHRDALAR